MTDTNITAATKLCVVLKCSYEANTVESIDLYQCFSPKCEKLPFNSTLNKTQPDIKSQESMRDSYLKKDCSSFSDLTEHNKEKKACPSFSTANVPFTGMKKQTSKSLVAFNFA